MNAGVTYVAGNNRHTDYYSQSIEFENLGNNWNCNTANVYVRGGQFKKVCPWQSFFNIFCAKRI